VSDEQQDTRAPAFATFAAWSDALDVEAEGLAAAFAKCDLWNEDGELRPGALHPHPTDFEALLAWRHRINARLDELHEERELLAIARRHASLVRLSCRPKLTPHRAI
jgi:hypothetical protein